MTRSVDYFDVGKEQLSELVDYDLSLNYGDYVVVSMGAVFGRVSDDFYLVERYCSEYWACRCAEDMQRISFTIAMHSDRACVCEYEVWHVVDDFYLWGNWDFRVREAKLDAQRKASACRISLDNGQTFLDPVRDDVDLQELVEYLDEYPYDWDGIVLIMDDETREFTHLTSGYTGMMPNECMSTAKINAMWLCDYLANAEQDLIR